MKTLAFVACIVFCSACSLVYSASDHQGGVLDAGAHDLGIVDAGNDASNDASDSGDAGRECTTNTQCDPSGLIMCMDGHCVWCVEPPVSATGTPAAVQAREPIHALIVPPDTSAHPARVLVSYATGDGPGDDPALVRTELEDLHVGEGAGDVFRVFDALPSAERDGTVGLFGFAFVAQTAPLPENQRVYWTAFGVRTPIAVDTQFFAFGDFFSSSEHEASAHDLTVGHYLAEPAALVDGTTPRYVARFHPPTGNNALHSASSGGSDMRTLTDERIGPGFASMSASGDFVALNASSNVLVWNPSESDPPLLVTTPGRSTRAVIATDDGNSYFLAYGAGATLYVLRAVCTRRPGDCNFEMFANIESSASSVDAPALRVLHGHPVLVARELSSASDNVIVRVLRADGDPYRVISSDPGASESAFTIDAQNASAFEHRDVDLAVADFDAIGPRIVVTYLRGQPSPATTPRLVAITRLAACQP